MLQQVKSPHEPGCELDILPKSLNPVVFIVQTVEIDTLSDKSWRKIKDNLSL